MAEKKYTTLYGTEHIVEINDKLAIGVQRKLSRNNATKTEYNDISMTRLFKGNRGWSGESRMISAPGRIPVSLALPSDISAESWQALGKAIKQAKEEVLSFEN